MKSLVLPGIRGEMGDWVYYVTTMKLGDVASRIQVADQIHTSQSLNDLIQRQLTPRADKISQYLLSQQQRFFNSLVIGVYGGKPNWYELSISGNSFLDDNKLPNRIAGSLGLLMLEGTENLFAIDGQHRVVGIKKALENLNETQSSLSDEEVSCIFVAHRTDEEGRERTRRLFSTLNRHAKPVSLPEIIALDEDDVIAIVTREIVSRHPLFQDKTAAKKNAGVYKSKSISASDATNFTSLRTLYDVLDIYFREKPPKKWSAFKQLRPSDEIIGDYYKRAGELFDQFTQEFEPLGELVRSKREDEVAAKYRSSKGGHLLFRPIGLEIAVTFVTLASESIPQRDAIRMLAKVPMQLNRKPWEGLLWDKATGTMRVGTKRKAIGVDLILYGLEMPTKMSVERLRSELAGELNRTPSQIKMMKFP